MKLNVITSFLFIFKAICVKMLEIKLKYSKLKRKHWHFARWTKFLYEINANHVDIIKWESARSWLWMSAFRAIFFAFQVTSSMFQTAVSCTVDSKQATYWCLVTGTQLFRHNCQLTHFSALKRTYLEKIKLNTFSKIRNFHTILEVALFCIYKHEHSKEEILERWTMKILLLQLNKILLS